MSSPDGVLTDSLGDLSPNPNWDERCFFSFPPFSQNGFLRVTLWFQLKSCRTASALKKTALSIKKGR